MEWVNTSTADTVIVEVGPWRRKSEGLVGFAIWEVCHVDDRLIVCDMRKRTIIREGKHALKLLTFVNGDVNNSEDLNEGNRGETNTVGRAEWMGVKRTWDADRR